MSNNKNNIGPQEVNKLITDWASPNENIRRPAEQAIEQLLLLSNGQIDNFVMTLCQLLSHPKQTSSDVRIRIAILLRKRIASKLDDQYKKPIFCQLNPNTRQQTLRVLLKQLSNDPDKDIRNQIADCIIELSTRTFTQLSNEYENVSFLKSIFELYNLSDTNTNNHFDIINRINALSIFGHLCQYLSNDNIIKQNQSSIAQIYKVAFKQDKSRKVNIAALEAIQLTMKPLKNEQVLGFIPLMFDVLKLLENTLNCEGKDNDNDEYEQTQYILEIIIQIACDQPTLFADHDNKNQMQSPLISFCSAFTQLCVTKQLPTKIRALSLEFFLSLAENDPSLARRKQIIGTSVINICLDHFLLEQINDKEWDDLIYGDGADEDYNHLSSTGELGLDRLISSLTSEYVLPTIYNKLNIIAKNNNNVNKNNNKYWNHSNWTHRHCALITMTQISDHIEHESNELLIIINKVIQLLSSDNNHRIKYAAINCVGQLSNDHFDMMANKFSNIILKNLLLALNINNHIKIQTHSCAALINFVPSLAQNQIRNQLSDLLNAVMNVLKNSNSQWQKCNDNQVILKQNYQAAQEQALTAIAALAATAGDLFNEHYDLFAPILMSIVKSAQSEDLQDVRCRAIECMGHFGEAVGGNKFKQHASELMNGTILFFKNRNMNEIADDPFIKTNICVWPRVLESIGNDAFYQYLPTLCGILHDVANINILSNRNEEIQKDDFDYLEFQEKNQNNDDENMAIIESPNGGLIALDSQKIENKLAAFFAIDSFSDKYGNKMETFIPKLFDILLQSMKCKYSMELRSECIKLSIRYMEVLTDNDCIMTASDKLLNVFISILDEGKKPGGDSGCIGVVIKALLEFINKIKDKIKRFINEERLEYIIDCMFLCVLRAQNRIEIYAKQEKNNSYDAIAKLEFEEEKEFEDDLLFNIAMILSEFIKIYKDDFLCILFKNNNMKKLLNFLNPNGEICNPQFVHKTGVYIICDIYEQCLVSNTTKLLNDFIPLIINIINNDADSASQQACFYCLGLMVNKCKNNTINYIQQILSLCMQCITSNSNKYINSPLSIFDETKENENYGDDALLLEKRQFLGVIDNAMATICKILKDIEWNNNNNNLLNKLRNESLLIWFKHLPIKSDCIEAQTCHEYLFKLLQNKNPIIIGNNLSNLPFIFKIFAMIRNTELSTKQLDGVIAEFAKTICKSQPQFVQNLSLEEKNNLGL